MSKKVLQYQETRLIKSKKPKSFKGLFVLSIFVLSLTLVLFLSGIFGNVLNINGFSFLFNKSSTIKVGTHSYYAVSMGNYATQNEAENVASGLSVMGAGSYVWKQQNKFYVIGNVYEKNSDAVKVLANVKTANYEPEVLEIKFDGFSFNHENYSKEQRQHLLNSIKFIDEIYKKCYNYSIKFDLSEVVATVVSSKINELKGDVKIWEAKLDSINSVVVTSHALLIKNAYIRLEQELEAAVLKVINASSVNKDLKYLTTAVVIIKKELYSSIKSL